MKYLLEIHHLDATRKSTTAKTCTDEEKKAHFSRYVVYLRTTTTIRTQQRYEKCECCQIKLPVLTLIFGWISSFFLRFLVHAVHSSLLYLSVCRICAFEFSVSVTLHILVIWYIQYSNYGRFAYISSAFASHQFFFLSAIHGLRFAHLSSSPLDSKIVVCVCVPPPIYSSVHQFSSFACIRLVRIELVFHRNRNSNKSLDWTKLAKEREQTNAEMKQQQQQQQQKWSAWRNKINVRFMIFTFSSKFFAIFPNQRTICGIPVFDEAQRRSASHNNKTHTEDLPSGCVCVCASALLLIGNHCLWNVSSI